MFKTTFHCKTESESFDIVANPMFIRQVAAIVLTERNAKFVEISYSDGSLAMMASYNPDAAEADSWFRFAFPEDTPDNSEDCPDDEIDE